MPSKRQEREKKFKKPCSSRLREGRRREKKNENAIANSFEKLPLLLTFTLKPNLPWSSGFILMVIVGGCE